jgi:hypothetical protein
MVDTLNTCCSSTCVTAILFYVHQIWITNKVFKQIFCTSKCVYFFFFLASLYVYIIGLHFPFILFAVIRERAEITIKNERDWR